MKIAVIGTREPNKYQAILAAAVSKELSELGHDIATGGAYGIDQIAMMNTVPGHLLVYLPWYGYNKEIVPVRSRRYVYDELEYPEWRQSVYKYHPYPGSLTRGAISLHARNYGIVEGKRLVVAFPQEGGKGGTGQGIRIAEALGIPVICIEPNDNVTKDELIAKCLEILNQTGEPGIFIGQLDPKQPSLQ